jgi:serine/threonine protein kinase
LSHAHAPKIASTDEGDFPENVFMVFEYLEYDLTGILRTPEIRFSADHVKSWSYQLLQGTHYMHTNKVIHRDLKASNLLINKRGELKIADWGLARSYSADTKRLSPKVITLWYRPPELLLGSTDYTDKVDLWSCGCIIAEMFIRNGFLQGQEEVQQLQLIFKTFGHPTKEDWPDIDKKCRLWSKYKPDPSAVWPNRFREIMQKRAHNAKWLTENALSMLAELLCYNPDKRCSAGQASLSNYFFDDPPVKKAHELSMNFAVQSIHEWDCKRRHMRN